MRQPHIHTAGVRIEAVPDDLGQRFYWPGLGLPFDEIGLNLDRAF